jgi:hypothetical protein
MKTPTCHIISLSEYKQMRGLNTPTTIPTPLATEAPLNIKLLGMWFCFVLAAATAAVSHIPESYSSYAFYAAAW